MLRKRLDVGCDGLDHKDVTPKPRSGRGYACHHGRTKTRSGITPYVAPGSTDPPSLTSHSLSTTLSCQFDAKLT